MKIWNTKEIIMKSFLEVYWGWRYIKKFQWKLIRSVQVRLEVFWTGLFKGKNQTWLKGESILPSSLVEKLGDLEKKMLKSIPLPNHRLGRCPFQVLHHSINIIQYLYIYIYTRISGTRNSKAMNFKKVFNMSWLLFANLQNPAKSKYTSKFKSSPLKNDGWKTILSFWDGKNSGATNRLRRNCRTS